MVSDSSESRANSNFGKGQLYLYFTNHSTLSPILLQDSECLCRMVTLLPDQHCVVSDQALAGKIVCQDHHLCSFCVLARACLSEIGQNLSTASRLSNLKESSSLHCVYGYVHVATRRRRPTIPSHPWRQRSTLYATERAVLSRVCLLFSKISNLQRLRLLGISSD